MVRNNMFGVRKPELRDLGEDNSFVGYRLVHNNIERRDSVGCDEEQYIAEVVDIANLATVLQFEIWKVGF
jgi:hypothetical protein